MASKTIRICDRCKKQIEYCGWTAWIKGLRFRKIFMRKILNGNPDGYSYSDWHIELCADCTHELENFLWRADNGKI